VSNLGFKAAIASVALLISAATAQAGFVLSIQQVGPNVIASGNGALDTTGLLSVGTMANSPLVDPGHAEILNGPAGTVGVFHGVTGPTSFGSSPLTLASSGQGEFAGIFGFDDVLFVPLGYLSHTPLSNSSGYVNKTLAGLGLTLGTYEWTWGTGVDQNFTVQIGPVSTPEPASVALFTIGLAGLALARRRRLR